MAPSRTATGSDASWHRYRTIADNSSDLVLETTPDGIIRWVSPTVQQLLGYTMSQFRGTSARGYVHPDDLAMVNELRLTVYAGEELGEVPCRFRTAGGAYRDCTVRARPVSGDDGTVTGAVIAVRDAHEKTAALRALATLSRSNAVLVREREEEGLLQSLCETVAEVGGFLAVGYVSVTDDLTLRLSASSGPLAGALDEIRHTESDSEGLALHAWLTAETQVSFSPDTDDRLTPYHHIAHDHQLRAAIALPVRAGGKVDGVLVACSSDAHAFDSFARPLMEDLAADLGYGLERIRDAEELAESRARENEHRQRLEGILDAQTDPLVLLEAVRDGNGTVVDLRYVEANAAALAYNGLRADQQLGRLFTEMHPTLVGQGITKRYLDVVETGEPVVLDDYSYANPNLGDLTRRYDIRAARCGDGITLTWRDVTDRYLAAQRVRESEHRYRVLTENASDIVWETAADGTMAWVSESVTRVLGWRPDQLLGRSTVALFHPDHRGRAAYSRDLALTGVTVRDEFRLLTADGGDRWMALSAQQSQRDGASLRIVSLRDIHEEVVGRTRLEHAVLHDPLTGLVNRAEMRRRVQVVLDAGDGVTAVLKLGIDGLSRVNEALGHAAGDRVLAVVAERIVDVLGEVDLAARGSGDELIAMVPGLADGADVGQLADELRAAVRRPVVIAGQELVPTVSIGIATSQRTAEDDAERLLGTAGNAMRAAKRIGPDRTAFVDQKLADAAGDRLALEADLRAAIPRGELRPLFQPVVALNDGTVVGYEALVRWFRADGVVVPPDDFLPVAERGSLVLEIDRSIITQSVAALRQMPPHQHLAVNVSAASLGDPGYPPLVQELLASAGVDPSRLVLELTETALLQSIADVRGTVERLAALGVRWYVDDFGTGYSSIAHLRDLPVAGLKLDRSFTTGIGSGDPTCIRLAQALAGLAEGLGLDTVAEGIETQEEESRLAEQGWKHGQGWLYGKAAPLPDPS